MNQISQRRKKISIIIILIVGLVCILLGVYHNFYMRSYFENGEKITAVVINILVYPESSDSEYDNELKAYLQLLEEYKEKNIIDQDTGSAIIISYEYQEEEYTRELGYFSNDIHIGQRVDIYIRNNDPLDFKYTNRSNFAIIVSFVLGTLCVIYGAFSLFILVNNEKANIYLKNNGIVYKAKVLYIDENEKVKKFNRHPLILTCSYINEETSEEQVFISDSIYLEKNSTDYIDKYVNVYVDSKNENNYYVDTNEFFERK